MNTSSSIEVRGLRQRYGGPDVLRGVDLSVAPGSVVALLGPSGCGKTTLLRSIAGLERPYAGEIRIGDRPVRDDRTFVAPERRRIGMVFQDWALFPHLSVAANVGYGLPRAERRGPRVVEALEMVGLGGFGDRAPATLSGGQQQRVALARALAPHPSVLLLDEPFSNLDTSLRVEVRAEVHQLLAELGITTVFVTHDQEEAFVLGDHVAVMLDGEIVQQAPPAVLYDRPATPWVARFVGDANLLAGRADGSRASTGLGVLDLRDERSGPVQVLARPEELRLEAAGDGAGTAVVELVEYYGHDCVTFARLEGGEVVRVRAGSAPRHARGDRVVVRYAGGPVVAFTASAPTPAAAAGADPGATPGGGPGATAVAPEDPSLATR
ncbi:MAG: ABC transporter ATP-binding protein [Acidimicrobiia bacterium]